LQLKKTGHSVRSRTDGIGSNVRYRTDEYPRLSHIINAGMAMAAVINGSCCAGC